MDEPLHNPPDDDGAEQQSLKRRAQILEAVHQVAADIASELELRPVLRRIMDRAVGLLDARRGGGIYLYDTTEHVLRLTEVSGINEGRIGTVVRLDEGMAGQVFRTGQPLIVNDYANWPGRATVLVPWPSSAVMGVPLFLAGRVIGVLGVFDDSHRRTFIQVDVEAAQIFAAHAAIAIHNAQLYDQAQQEIGERQRVEEALRQANDLLESRVAERTKQLATTNAHLAREIEERVDAESARRLAELEIARLRSNLAHVARINSMGELTASLAHELNQPLTAILANVHVGSRMLATGSMPSAEVREIFAEVAADARRAGEVIRRIRGLLLKEELKFVPLDIGKVLREVLVLVRTDAIMKRATMGLEIDPALPLVRGDRVQLQQVLLNLIMNGLEAMEETPAEDRKLVIRMEKKGQQILVALQDAGVGIPEENLGQIFSPFFTSKPRGLGMGLAICRSIIEAHGGKIWPENNPAGGTTLHFSLPLMSPADVLQGSSDNN